MTDLSDAESQRESLAQSGGLSRRELLGGGILAAAALSGQAMAQGSGSADAEEVRIDLTFRALISRDPSKPAAIESIRLRPLTGRQVLVRLLANQLCYSDASQVLGGVSIFPGGGGPRILGHQGVGVVEAIGPAVRTVQTGDRVFIAVTAHCGSCYNCNRGRAEWCSANLLPSPVLGDLSDGTPIGGGTGGLGEYTVNFEERLIPIFSDVSAEELSILTCVGSTGLGMTCALHQIESGSTVVVFGAGPVGLSAIQGARIQGAAQIIAIEPIPARRELALKLGATDAVDPNEHVDDLVSYVRGIVKAPTTRIFAGGREITPPGGFGFGSDGPDYVIEAVGRQWQAPLAPQGPDPTGLEVLRQVWDLVPPGSWGFTAGVNHLLDDEISLPAEIFTNGGKTMMSCQNGGIQTRRDLPRFVRLIEQGRFDAKSMITKTHKFDNIIEAYQEVMDRTVVANVITF